MIEFLKLLFLLSISLIFFFISFAMLLNETFPILLISLQMIIHLFLIKRVMYLLNLIQFPLAFLFKWFDDILDKLFLFLNINRFLRTHLLQQIVNYLFFLLLLLIIVQPLLSPQSLLFKLFGESLLFLLLSRLLLFA